MNENIKSKGMIGVSICFLAMIASFYFMRTVSAKKKQKDLLRKKKKERILNELITLALKFK